MAVDGSSVAIQVGTAVKFPLASNQGQALCLFCEMLMAVVCFLQQGVMLLPERAPTASASGSACVFSAPCWYQAAECPWEDILYVQKMPVQPLLPQYK